MFTWCIFILEHDANLDNKPSDHNSTATPDTKIMYDARDEGSSNNEIVQISNTQNLDETIITIQSEEGEPFISQKEDEKGKWRIKCCLKLYCSYNFDCNQ